MNVDSYVINLKITSQTDSIEFKNGIIFLFNFITVRVIIKL